MQSRSKILITDDNATNIEILEEVLADKYQVTPARSGEETLAILEEYHPDLVLLDIMMPGIDGYETCRRIRAIPRLNNVKVIMVSAKAMVSERLKGYESGADDYITKPFDEEELLAKVRVYLRLKTVEEVDQLKSNLLTLLNHETRTPLNGIVGPIEMLMSGDMLDSKVQKQCLDIMNRSAQQLHQLFEKVLKLCSMKAGKWHFKLEETDLSEVIAQATKQLEVLAAERDVKITQHPGNVVANVDRKEMNFVVRALVHNAIKYSPAGGKVEVGVSTEPDHLLLRVSDTGDGIDADRINLIFDEFNQLSVDNHSDGQRLSLAIAQQVAAAHQGKIEVDSRKGQGTTFTIKLPLEER